MTLEQFIDCWTRKYRTTVILCDEKDYDDMFDLVDEIRDGKKDITFLEAYSLGGFITSVSEYKETYLLKDRFTKGTVENFYIEQDYMVIWITPYEVKETAK